MPRLALALTLDTVLRLRRGGYPSQGTEYYVIEADSLDLDGADPVAEFTDLSGNGRHFTADTGSPVFRLDRLNGYPAVEFTNDRMRTAQSTEVDPPWVRISVVKDLQAGLNTQRRLFDTRQGATTQRGRFGYEGASPGWRLYNNNKNPATGLTSNTALQNFRVVRERYCAGATGGEFHLDGAPVMTGADLHGAAQSSDRFYLGAASNDPAATFCNMELVFQGVYGDPTSAMISAVESYLFQKYFP